MTIRPLALALLLVAPAWADTPPAEPDVPALPDVAPLPPPAPSPTAVMRLLADTYFVVTHTSPCTVLASPDGLVKVEAYTLAKGEALLLRGKFVDGSKTETRRYTRPHVYVVTAAATGRCELIVLAENSRTVIRRTLDVDAGEGPRPPPVPPTPPVPPQPTPGPAPIPLPGLRVLFAYETSALRAYPPGQLSVLYSRTVRDYLDAKCAKGADGKTPEKRFLDPDTDLSKEAQHWQDVLKRPRTALPWMVISNGVDGYEGPVPNSVEEAMTLLKRFGGQ